MRKCEGFFSFILKKKMEGFKAYYTYWVDSDITNQTKYFTLRYCYSKGYVIKKNDGQDKSLKREQLLNACPRPLITVWDGGSIHFPYVDRFTILKKISQDIEAGSQMFFNQIAYEKDGFRLIIDIDSKRLISEMEIQQFKNKLKENLLLYYPETDKPFDIWIQKCGPRMKDLKLSTGVHFIVHLKVNMKEARQITYGYDLRVRGDPSINMKDIEIDLGLYKPVSGEVSLRMIHSNKLDKCVMCKAETLEQQSCLMCNKRGMIVSKFCYEPLILFNNEEEVEKVKEAKKDWFSILSNNSIWPEPGDERPGYKKPDLDPEVPNDFKKRKTPESKQTNTKIRVSNATFDFLQEEIRKFVYNSENLWKDLIVQDIKVFKTNAQIDVDGVGSSWCLYANTDHGSRHFFFSLSKKAMVTFRCNSEKCKDVHKDPDRVIKFQIAQRVTNTIFGLQNVPLNDVFSSGVAKKKQDIKKQQQNAQVLYLTQVYKVRK
jgi:hypothetical protein